MNQPIIIVGFMGSGKTTVAYELAALLESEAVDLDQVIAKTVGRTAREIIEEDSESAFRVIETRTLRKVLSEGGSTVIALGGGAWIQEENRGLIALYDGLSVWIDAPFDLCWNRIAAAGADRPLARSRAQAHALYLQRKGIYELADLHIDGGDPARVASAIKAALESSDLSSL